MKRKQALVLFGVALMMAGCAGSKDIKKENTEESGVTLTGLLLDSISDEKGSWEGNGAEELWEDTKVRLEFYAGGSRGDIRLRQYMAAGTLPDVIGFNNDQRRLLQDAGLLLPLDGYAQMLQNIFQNEVYDTALSYCRDSFGGEEKELYLLPVEVGEKAADEYYWLPMLQWQPYEQAGCPKIEVLEDYLDAAEKMLRCKSTTPTGEQVYGFSLFSEWDAYTAQAAGDLSYLYGRDTGMISPLMELDVEKNELRAVTDADSFYKEALHFYFTANQRNLLDPDSRTQTYDSLRRKYDQGRILFSQYQHLTEGYNREARQNGFALNRYVPVVAEDMRIYRESDNPTGNGWYYGITTSCREPEKACALLNWLYDPAHIRKLYTHPEDMEPFQNLGLSRRSAGIQGETMKYRTQDKETGTYTEEESMERYLKERNLVITGSNAVNMLPGQSGEIRTRCMEIGEVVRELSWDMIYAGDEKQFKTLWRKMQKEAQKLGISEVKNYYRTGWLEALEKEKEYGQK